jgi:hypothetical protein
MMHYIKMLLQLWWFIFVCYNDNVLETFCWGRCFGIAVIVCRNLSLLVIIAFWQLSEMDIVRILEMV